MSIAEAVSRFGSAAKSKLANPAATGEREDQLRAPFERLVLDIAMLLGIPTGAVVSVGETALAAERSRPDYSLTLRSALTGFVELKAPGKGADPRRFKGHDKQQWQRLNALPNLIYSDGNEFSLWRNGELALPIVRLVGDIESSGSALGGDARLTDLFETFFAWNPIAPKTAPELATLSARLCRLLRDDVTEALARRSDALTTLAKDWRDLLFPSASDEQFADGYAQAVTFGLLMARARGISVGGSLHAVSSALQPTSSLIGTALQLLTDSAEARQDLSTSLPVLQRVLEGVDWARISKGRADAWLYFYEQFLEVYDSALRKKTGSYYTPPEVVSGMVRLVDEVLRQPGFALNRGIAASEVTVADPATGTGTFVIGVLRQIAATVEADEGVGAVGSAIQAAMQRIVAFELQLGPFAVAQLRVLAEAVSLTGMAAPPLPRMFVTDTLSDPHDDGGNFPGFLAPIGRQRRAANRIKRDEPIMVVIGNPPYKEKAKGQGGWVRGRAAALANLRRWTPGCRRVRGGWAPIRSIFAISTSTFGAGRHGRYSSSRRTTVSLRLSRWPASWAAPAFRQCERRCGSAAMKSGLSTRRPRAISPRWRRASSREFSSQSASSSRHAGASARRLSKGRRQRLRRCGGVRSRTGIGMKSSRRLLR